MSGGGRWGEGASWGSQKSDLEHPGRLVVEVALGNVARALDLLRRHPEQASLRPASWPRQPQRGGQEPGTDPLPLPAGGHQESGQDCPADGCLLCLTVCDPTDCNHQAPFSMGFARQEYWSRLPFPTPRDLPTLARDGVSREVPCSALKGETVPDIEEKGSNTF